MFKTKFNYFLLSITSDNKFWRSQLDILHLSIQHNNRGHLGGIQFKEHFAIIMRPLTKKIMVLVYRSTILVHFTMATPFTDFPHTLLALPHKLGNPM